MFQSHEGIDFSETFSQTSSKDYFKMLWQLDVHVSLRLLQMDVKTVFLRKNPYKKFICRNLRGIRQKLRAYGTQTKEAPI